jgi:hypothetical protein
MLASIYGLFSCTLDKGNLPPKGKAFFSFTFMGKNSSKKYYHEVQEKVLEYVIKNHPDKIREIEYQSPVVISKNKLIRKKRAAASCLTVTIWRISPHWPE